MRGNTTWKAEVRHDGDRILLVAPSNGMFRPAVAVGDHVWPGTYLGDLQPFAHVARLLVPEGVRGVIVEIEPGERLVTMFATLAVIEPAVVPA